jgi:nucleotide-binding universal stress UspA family protein
MTRKLLVPVDLASEEPLELRFAADLANSTGATVTLLHVIDYVPMLLPVELPGGYPLPQIDIVREAVAKKLERMAASLGRVHARTLIEVGGAATQIIEVAQRDKFDQIIIGSHSRRAVTRIVLGSVADRVAHSAPCPVTIVREPRH